MYTWGYIKDVTLAKLDIDEREATVQNLISRFPFYANEAMTQICSAIKPNRTFAEFEIYDKQRRWDFLVNKHKVSYDKNIVNMPSVIPENEKLFWEEWSSSIFTYDYCSMPDDFISFRNDVNTREYTEYGDTIFTKCSNEDFSYKGYNKLQFYKEGKYYISYNARWIMFTKDMPDNTKLNIPIDILDCLPSYIAHQCYKIDDENKSSIYRNEYEMFLARIDDSDYSNTGGIFIGGNW
jgi:hypothetical protein